MNQPYILIASWEAVIIPVQRASYQERPVMQLYNFPKYFLEEFSQIQILSQITEGRETCKQTIRQ